MPAFLIGELEAGERVDRALAALTGAARSQVQRWIAAGCVLRNGTPPSPSAKLAVGDRLEVDPPEPVGTAVEPEPMALDVLYEDAELIVIDKPAGLVVHPAPGHERGTLVNGLLHHCRDLAGIGGVLRPGIVHRLDRGTSGVMVAAKTDRAHLALARQFHDHTIEREYRAFVRAIPTRDSGRIQRAIGRHPRDRKRMSVVTRRGRAAATNWRVVSRWPDAGLALLEIRPETGRTHQIRVHLASEGMPIAGDTVYGRVRRAKHAIRAARALARPALHAALLGFVHPTTDEAMRFSAPLPDDLEALVQAAAEA